MDNVLYTLHTYGTQNIALTYLKASNFVPCRSDWGSWGGI